MDKTSGLRLNKEQCEAIKFGNGPLLIVAGAGTGKTTVITERIKYLIFGKKAKPSEILALTFTEKAAREMEERVDVALPYGYTQMWIMTFHSFCDKILRREALHIGLDPKYKLMTEAESIQFLRKNLFKLELDYFRPLGNPNKFLSGMLQHFSRLQDEDISPNDYLKWIKKGDPDFAKWQELAKAYKAYDELKVKEGLMDFGDLIVKTLKLFRDRPNILSEYQKQFKYVLIDEFQDTNHSQNELAILLAGKEKNINVVGDDDQCLPPNAEISTPKGVAKIKDIKVGDEILTAVGKGHTSISKVTNIFKRKKQRVLLTFKMRGGEKLTITNNHKMFCFVPAHTNLKEFHFVYIMKHPRFGWRVGVTNNLAQRLRFERHADYIIGIGSYKTNEEARFWESFYSAKYGIPTVPFTPRPNQAISGVYLERLFREINTSDNIKNLARDLNIELDSPQFMPNGVIRGETNRVKINFEMCFRNYRNKTSKRGFMYNPTVLHTVSLETSNESIKRILKNNNYNLETSKSGVRMRKTFSNLEEAWKFADKLQKLTGGIIDKKFKVGRFNHQHLASRIVPASHVFPGMYLPVLKNREIVYEKVVERGEQKKEIETYDLEIEKTHNFIADKVVVHNSIYRFRGAAISNIVSFRNNFPKAKVIVLTKNYRSTQEILDRSYDLIQNNNPDRLEVVEKIDKRLKSQVTKDGNNVEFIHADRVENEADRVAKKILELQKEEKYLFKDFAILVRANNHSEPIMRALGRNGIPFQFLGPGRLFKQPEIVDLVSYLKVLNDFTDSVSFYRLLSIDFFGISGREVSEIGNYAKKNNISLFEAAEKKGSQKVKVVTDIINKHLDLVKKESAGQILYFFLEETGFLQKLLSPESAEAEKRAKNISKFFDKLKTYEVDHEDNSVSAVVDYLDLSMELGESPLANNEDWTEINAVNILTVHSAKGLEFPVVFLINLVNQRFPSMERREQIPIPESLIREVLPIGDFHLEEERRLFYVGMTRAKERLVLTAADYYGEGKREKKLSPFIFESLGDKNKDLVKPIEKVDQLSFLDYQAKPKREEVFEKLKVNYLSYSQIETFQICPLHYKLKYIYKIPTPVSASQSFGTAIHNTLRDFFEEVKKGTKPTDKFIFDLLEKNWIVEGYKSKKHEREFFDKGKLYLSGFLKQGFDQKTLPSVLEQPFTVPVAKNLKIGGRIDRVDSLGKEGIEIIDYKTGATIPTQREVDKNLQLSFYAIAASRIPTAPFGIDPEKIKLSLYFLDTQEKISTVRTKKQIEEAVKEITSIRDEIEKSDFKCSGHMFCQMGCEFSLFCKSEE